MHRFRKKSDAKRPPFAVSVSSTSITSSPPALDTLPALPAVNDFRTSLILPSLTKRFSVLRSQQGDLSLDALRYKFEEQRAKGSANQITEEEEDMMIEALTGITKGASATRDGVVDEDELDLDYYTTAGVRGSTVPSTPSSSSTAYPRSSASEASPASTRASKRASSNLFGSGRFRDQSYIRSVRDRAISQTSSSGSLSPGTPRGRYTSLDGSAASMTRENSSSTLASVHDEDAADVGSGSGSGKDMEKTPIAKPLHLSPASPAPVSSLESVSETSLLGTLTALSPARQKRMSMALETALLDLTGVDMPLDDEDIVLAPRSVRSPPPPVLPRSTNGSASHRPLQLQHELFVTASAQKQHATEPIAPNSATSDEFDSASTFMLRDDDPFALYKRDGIKDNGSLPSPPLPQRAPASPTSIFPPRATSPRIPGYIPGMQRPTSPRDVERSDSTTPRATAPPTHSTFRPYRETGRAPISSPQLPASILSRSALPRSDSPAPGLHQHSHSKSSSFGALADFSRFTRDSPGPEQQQQQPASFKQTSSGRPMSPPTNRTPTPGREGANLPAWYANAAYYQQHINRGTTPDYSREGGTPSHSRHGSVMSDETDPYGPVRGRGPALGAHARTKSGGSVRSLSSPALPDSPLLDGAHNGAFKEYGSIAGAWDLDPRISSIDIGAPAVVHAANAGRPTTPRSPPFLARSPSLTRSPSQTRGVASDGEYPSARQYTSTPPPAPSAGLGRPRTPSRAMHSPSSSASSSFNNINAVTTNPLILSPFNASAASVASAGSSYHSEPGDETDENLDALLHPGTKKRKWDDFTGEIAGTGRIVVQLDDRDDTAERPAEEVLVDLMGLTKDDIVMLQRRLLDAALQMKSTVDAPASRPPSLRRRRGSIGQTMGGPQSPSRTTSPGPLSPHVSPKNSVSPFSSPAAQPLSAALSSTTSLSPSAAPSSSSGSATSLGPSAPLSPLSPLAPSSPPYSSANLTGSDTEREKTPAPRPSDRGARANALLSSMMESIDKPKARSHQAPAPSAAPVLAPPVAVASAPLLPNFARPLSPQLQSPRAMSPIPAAAIAASPARAKSPPLMKPKSPPPSEPLLRATSPVESQPQVTRAHHDPSSSQSSDLSSILRNKALADAIFGMDDDQPVSAAQALSSEPSSQMSTPEQEFDPREPSPPTTRRAVVSPSPVPAPHRLGSPPPGSRRYASPSPLPHDYSPSPDFEGYSPSPNKQGYNSSSPLPPDDAQLEQDVRRKVELATAALKQSPSHASLRERSGSVRRKKIDPNKISVPQLMSASTSLDAVPLIPASRSQLALSSPSEPRSGGNKLTQRFKKLGGWRSKPTTPNTDDPQPFGHSTSTSPKSPSLHPSTGQQHPTVQTVRINPSSLSNLNGPASASAADISHYRFPPSSPGYSPQSPPASAGPAFKSFMSKFAKPFGASSTDLTASQRLDRERLAPQSPVFGASRVPTSPTTPIAVHPVFSSTGRSVEGRYGGTPVSPLPSDTFPRGRASIDDDPSARKSPELALRQIFDGAAQAGLNPTQMEELSALLNRSLSTSSRATAAPGVQTPDLTRSNSSARPTSPPAPERKSTLRSTMTRSQGPTPRATRDEDTRSVVVRRTIYLTSDSKTVPASEGLSRRPSHRKRGSETGGSIHSGKSIQERAGSPPPRAAPKRFSSDAAPPVPLLSANYLDALGTGATGGSTSSLVDVYSDEAASERFSARSPFPSSISQRNGERSEQTQALEVLEFADGRVVWQIVDGLRAAEDLDFDGESGFRSRASFDSGYSLPDREAELQLQLREHKRMPSKSSATSSTLNRKSAYNRPETKVFYSDPDHIGRLIDSMTRGMNSGSFNVVPNMPTPTVSSFADAQAGKWTMEEHLDHVLDSLSPIRTSP